MPFSTTVAYHQPLSELIESSHFRSNFIASRPMFTIVGTPVTLNDTNVYIINIYDYENCVRVSLYQMVKISKKKTKFLKKCLKTLQFFACTKSNEAGILILIT